MSWCFRLEALAAWSWRALATTVLGGRANGVQRKIYFSVMQLERRGKRWSQIAWPCAQACPSVDTCGGPAAGAYSDSNKEYGQNEAIGWFYTCVMGMVTTREAHRTPTIPSDFRVSGRL